MIKFYPVYMDFP